MSVLDNVQGIVAQSSSRQLVVVLLFRVVDRSAAKALLREWLRFVPRGLDQQTVERPSLHIAFSWSGLEELLRGHSTLDIEQGRREFEWSFTDPDQGPDRPALSEQLGFVGDSEPQHWWNGAFATGDIHVAVFTYFVSPEQKTQWLAEMRASASAGGLEELPVVTFSDKALSGYRPADGRLHFGYRDGISAPVVDWGDTGKRPGLVDLREFVVGYPTHDYPTSPQRPGVWQDFARDGSYLGLTWIYQDVPRFNAFLKESEDADAGVDREWIAARMMGRWRDGSPVTHYPDRPPSQPELGDDFGYADDRLGLRCPLTAHIRIVNCRDQELSFANQVRFPEGPPRLIRRGFSYGPPHVDGIDDDEKDRGIVGAFFCARLNEQFYTVLRWMQEASFSETFSSIPNGFKSQDLLLGNRAKPRANTDGYIPRNGAAPLRLRLPDFIRYRGVAALFMPSLSALGILAAPD